MKSYTAIRLEENGNGMGPARNSALVSMCVWTMYIRVTKEGDDVSTIYVNTFFQGGGNMTYDIIEAAD